MVPEWALFIFMKRFGLTRERAVEQIRLQENLTAQCDDE